MVSLLLSIRRFTVRLRSARAESLFDCLKNRDEKETAEDAGGLPAVLINQESPFAFTIEISIASIYEVPFILPRYKLALLYHRFTLNIVVKPTSEISQVFSTSADI